MPAAQSSVGALRRLADYYDDVNTLNPVAFGVRHSEAFLLHFGSVSSLELPRGVDQTLQLEPSDQETSQSDPQADFLVFPVMRKEVFKRQGQEIHVGRTADNDVVLPDISVSARHALIYVGSKDVYEILDEGSRNGTLLDGLPVPVIGRGDAMRMRTGARLRIGRLGLTFLRVAEFHSLVERLAN